MSEYAKFTKPTVLEITRDLPASCERVWEYLVNPELRQKWFCAGETGTAAGESLVMDFDHSRISNSAPPESLGCSGDPQIVVGTIPIFEPPHKLAYLWPGETEADTSLVTIELTQVGEKTRLHLIHSRLANLDFQKGASAGWHTHLDLLVDHVSGNDVRDFWMHFEKVQAEYDELLAK